MNSNIEWEKIKKELEKEDKKFQAQIKSKNGQTENGQIYNFVAEKGLPDADARFYDPDKKKYFENLNKNDARRRRYADFNSNKKAAVLLNFDSSRGFENFKVPDIKAQKLRKEKILNGTAEKNAFETLSNFKPDELNNKLKFMMMIANNEERQNIVKKYTGFSSSGKFDKWEKGNITKEDVEEIFPPNKGGERIAENVAIKIIQNESKNNNKFYKNYEILESFVDEKTGVSGYVAGNKANGKVEIFFAGSNDPRNILTDPKTMKDWKNDGESAIITPPNYEVALKIAREVSTKTYKTKNGTYKGLDCANGHSKGGGEAMYVASHIKGLRAIVSDPSPVVNPGPYIGDNKILAVIPGNGNGMLNWAQEIPGSRYTTLYPKSGISEGKGTFKTSTVTAIAVPTAETRTKSKLFQEHFPDPEGSAKELESMRKYTERVKPIYEEYHKNKSKIKFSSNRTDLEKLVDEQVKENKISKTNFDKKWQAR